MITLTRPVLKRCPYRDEIDAGQLTITFAGDEAPELHALAAQIDDIAREPISHEGYTRAVRALIPDASRVVTEWRTGPWTVRVE